MSGGNKVEKPDIKTSASDIELDAVKTVDAIRADMRKGCIALAKIDSRLNQKNNPLYISCLNLTITLSNLDTEMGKFAPLVDKSTGAESE